MRRLSRPSHFLPPATTVSLLALPCTANSSATTTPPRSCSPAPLCSLPPFSLNSPTRSSTTRGRNLGTLLAVLAQVGAGGGQQRFRSEGRLREGEKEEWEEKGCENSAIEQSGVGQTPQMRAVDASLSPCPRREKEREFASFFASTLYTSIKLREEKPTKACSEGSRSSSGDRRGCWMTVAELGGSGRARKASEVEEREERKGNDQGRSRPREASKRREVRPGSSVRRLLWSSTSLSR